MALISCKDCKKEFSNDAKRCPHCGAKKPNPHYIIKGFMILVLIVWISGRLNSHQTNIDAGKTNGTVPSPFSARIAPEIPQWQYSTDKDAMSGKTSHAASIDSLNTLSFDFPYRGEQHATLTLTNHPRYGKQVIFSIEKGQFLCSVYDCKVLVKFDDAPPVRFSAVGPADHSTTSIFLSGHSQFLAKMQKAKKVRIEANFYQNNPDPSEFDVSKFDASRLE